MATSQVNVFSKLLTLSEIDQKEKELRDSGDWDNLHQLQAELCRFEIVSDLYKLDQENETNEESSKIKEQSSFIPSVAFRGKYMNIIQTKRIKVAKFCSKGFDFKLQFKRERFSQNLEQSLLNIYFAFNEFLDFVFKNTPETAFARFVIISEFFDKPVSICY